jgi:hypothetical protein
MLSALTTCHGYISWIAHYSGDQQHPVQDEQGHLIANAFLKEISLVYQWESRMKPSKIHIKHPLQGILIQAMEDISLLQEGYLSIDNILAPYVRRIKAFGNRKVKTLLVVESVAQKGSENIVDGISETERVSSVESTDGIANRLLCWTNALVRDM